jgi:hypothetical protein
MADQKQDQNQRHGRDVSGPNDPARTQPYQFNEPRPKEEIVKQAYDHETPTPTQEENDQAKLDAIFQPPGSGDPQQAAAKKKQQDEERRKQMEAKPAPGTPGYQTRATTPQS